MEKRKVYPFANANLDCGRSLVESVVEEEGSQKGTILTHTQENSEEKNLPIMTPEIRISS